MEENKKKNSIIIYFVFGMISMLIFGIGIGYLLFNNNDNSKKEDNNITENNDNKDDKKDDDEKDALEISESLLNELKEVASINYVDGGSEFFVPLLYANGIFDEFDKDLKTRVIYYYAVRHQKGSNVSDKEAQCSDGAGFCVGIKVDDFNDAMKKFGTLNFVPEIYGRDCRTYKGMYLFSYGGYLTEFESLVHDANAVKNGEDIVLTDNVTLKSSAGDTTMIKEYTFKKSSDGNQYYLYSVYTK